MPASSRKRRHSENADGEERFGAAGGSNIGKKTRVELPASDQQVRHLSMQLGAAGSGEVASESTSTSVRRAPAPAVGDVPGRREAQAGGSTSGAGMLSRDQTSTKTKPSWSVTLLLLMKFIEENHRAPKSKDWDGQDAYGCLPGVHMHQSVNKLMQKGIPATATKEELYTAAKKMWDRGGEVKRRSVEGRTEGDEHEDQSGGQSETLSPVKETGHVSTVALSSDGTGLAAAAAVAAAAAPAYASASPVIASDPTWDSTLQRMVALSQTEKGLTKAAWGDGSGMHSWDTLKNAMNPSTPPSKMPSKINNNPTIYESAKVAWETRPDSRLGSASKAKKRSSDPGVNAEMHMKNMKKPKPCNEEEEEEEER